MIKRKAKVSQVTIYKLFHTKDNLITAAIKDKSDQAVNLITGVLKSDSTAYDRMQNYFRTSFTIALTFPRQKDIIEYTFSGMNEDLQKHVASSYEDTVPYLEKLYKDAKKESIIRDEITFEQFLKMCSMYTRITPEFYQTKEDMDRVVKSIIKSFG